jgi:hypothetical protein
MPARRHLSAPFVKYETGPRRSFQHSKAVGRYAANVFALSPIRAAFSDSIRRVSKPVVKQCG